jgi:hypothetical protein
MLWLKPLLFFIYNSTCFFQSNFRLLKLSEYGKGRIGRSTFRNQFHCNGDEEKLSDCVSTTAYSCPGEIVAIQCSNSRMYILCITRNTKQSIKLDNFVSKNNKCSPHHCRPSLQKNLGRGSPFNLTSISYSYRNIRQKRLKFWKFDEKRAITPRWVIRFSSKLQGS